MGGQLLNVHALTKLTDFAAQCAGCGAYTPAAVVETRLGRAEAYCLHFCVDCCGRAYDKAPIFRECDGCGASRDVRADSACLCGCRVLRQVGTTLSAATIPDAAGPGRVNFHEFL